jgi:intracellular sulfur oxidation DsrE/DsrF family protein
MKKLLILTVAACLAGGIARSASGEDPTTFKAVIHVNFDDADRQKQGLKNVGNMLKGVKESDIEVVCHGKGIGLLLKDKSAAPGEIATLMKSGVRFAACENTMREKSIKKEDLLPGVVTVPSGAVEVIRKQQAGHGYFKP